MGDALQSQAKSGRKTRSTRQAQQDEEVSKRGILGEKLRIGSMYGRGDFELGRASRQNNQQLKIGRIQTADRGTGICVALGRCLDAAISARRCQFGEGN